MPRVVSEPTAADAAAARDRSAPEKRRSWFERLRHPETLRLRLVLAFLLVGPLPMFFAAELVSQIVTEAFKHNLRIWLGETAAYFIGSVADSERETGAVARVLTQQSWLFDQLIDGNHQMPPLLAQLIPAEGYDLLALLDESGNIVYSTGPVRRLDRIVVGDGVEIYEVDDGKQVHPMASSVQPFQYKGRQYQLLLAMQLDDGFFGRVNSVSSFNISIYALHDGQARQIFQLQPSTTLPPVPSPEVIRQLQANGSEGVFEHAVGGGDGAALYVPLRNEVGRVQGIVYCALRTQRWLGMVSHLSIFLIVFLSGTLLSTTVGFAVSRRLAKPLRTLADGVRAITAGRYQQRIELSGRDEVAELAVAFNNMAARLKTLHEMEDALRRKDRLSALGLAAAGIAHEVRNPLGIIRTSTELVRRRHQFSEADARLLDNVVDEVRRIDALIRDFLDFANPQPLALSLLAVGDIVRKVTHFCAPELAKRKIELRLATPTPDVAVYGEADALYQAFLNVILNAMDAMPNGGTLRIDQRLADDGLHILFTDSGPGVPDAVRNHVFDPFVTTKARGTGLGLSKVLSVMESHGGRVECRNLPEGGACFDLMLPLEPPPGRWSADADASPAITERP